MTIATIRKRYLTMTKIMQVLDTHTSKAQFVDTSILVHAKQRTNKRGIVEYSGADVAKIIDTFRILKHWTVCETSV